MDLNKEILSNIVIFEKYAKFIEEKKRRETFNEIAYRNRDMHLKKYSSLPPEMILLINKVYDEYVLTKKILPSMRSMQFAGKPIELSPNRMYNCCYAPVDDVKVFPEIMFLLLGGTGVGYSVQKHHIEKLPTIKTPGAERRFLIGDSIEGWADSIRAIVQAYFLGKPMPRFDFRGIRKKGSRLVTSGGKAPGPEPLKVCLQKIQTIFERKNVGDKIKTLEVHDIICHIADAVLAGGIRRAACISLFSYDDEEMLTCKFGNWWEQNPQRGRANNTAMLLRHRITEKDFFDLWTKIRESRSGEPGFYFSNNSDWGVNPCCEIALRPFQFCNLVEVNIGDIETQEELNCRVKAAALLATLQAGYTDFHYLRGIWKRNTEKEALIGVSFTGVASNSYKNLNLEEAARHVREINSAVADMIGIRPAARQTCLKPAGTTSLVFGSSSGIGPWMFDFYIRRIKLGKGDPIYTYLKKQIPMLLEDDILDPKSAYLCIPIAAPNGATTSDKESPIDLLERIKHFSQKWIKPGHVSGDNSHNVSATVYVGDSEWEETGKWMWENREYYNGLSVLPKDLGTYKQTPFEKITEEEYKELSKYLAKIDLTQVTEDDDKTDQSGEAACAGGVCELKFN
jgi:ribonucleoside-diphosphate reductase alpha chain